MKDAASRTRGLLPLPLGEGRGEGARARAVRTQPGILQQLGRALTLTLSLGRGDRRHTLLRLAISAAANAASSHALLLFTLAVASATAALNPLRPLHGPALALAVLASYLAWFVGLGLNAHANWKLLERNGVSVSATAKLLHDAAGRAGTARPLRYGATVFGFVVWEALEEVPWVLGALGVQAAAAHNHGWSFLAGSNAGAAVYNLAQSGLLSRVHSRRHTASR